MRKCKVVYSNLQEKLKILDLLEGNTVANNLIKIDFNSFNSDFISPSGIIKI